MEKWRFIFEILQTSFGLCHVFLGLIQALFVGIASYVIFINIKQLKLEKNIFQVDLFHKRYDSICKLTDKWKQGMLKDDVFYLDYLRELEFLSYFANRNFLTKDSIEFFIPTIKNGVKKASTFDSIKSVYKDRQPGHELCELQILYEKLFPDEKFPFPLSS